MRDELIALPVDEAAGDEIGEESGNLVLPLAQHEGEGVEIGQRAVMLAGDAEQVDPALEDGRRQALHLRVLRDFLVKAKPAAHERATGGRPVSRA